jgi:hypothetical protein
MGTGLVSLNSRPELRGSIPIIHQAFLCEYILDFRATHVKKIY